MPHHDVPGDVFMDDRHDVKCRPRRFHGQSFDDGDADRAERLTIAEAKADVEGPLADDRSERAQDHLRCFRKSVVAC
jgi:hypothetical protein